MRSVSLFSSAASLTLAALLATVTDPLPALMASLGVTDVEAIPWPLYDNLTIPLAACAALLAVGA